MNQIEEYIPYVRKEAIKHLEFLEKVIPEDAFQKLCHIISQRLNSKISKEEYYLSGNDLMRPYFYHINGILSPLMKIYAKSTNIDLKRQILNETPYLSICINYYLLCKSSQIKSIPAIPCI